MFSLKGKFILYRVAPVVFLVLSFISFLYLESVTKMKPGPLHLAFRGGLYRDYIESCSMECGCG